MSNEIQVTKRDGSRETLDVEKLHKVVFYACQDVTGVSASEVEIKSQIQFYNGISTKEIQETLIKAAADLITEEAPNYQYVGGRLINYALRKEVYGEFDPWHVKELVEKNTERGFYDPELLKSYSDEEWNKINGFIKHDRDESLTYIAMEQLRGKYLCQNRVTNEIFETPQMCYVLIAATLFSRYPKDERLQWVKDYYDAVSTHDISLPTPVMAGVRTPQRQFSSCVLIETDDSLDSINATTSAVVKYVSQKAGIGIGAGSIRAIGSPIRRGDAYHTGVIPFYKLFQSAVKSCSQGGVRGGAATLYYPIWHLEIEDMLVLKNNKGTEDNRVRHMDYGVQFNKLMYERLISGGDITLFSPHDVPGLYEAFFCDQDLFKDLYETAERNTRLRKKTVKAIELFSQFMDERKNTGRVYLQNVDNANDHGSFLPELAPIRQSNLCSEIDLPTKPLNDINDGAHRRKIRIPKEKYQEYLEYKKSVNGILRLDKEKFNGKKGTQGTTMENDWLYEIVESDTNVREDEDYIYEDELVEDYDGAAISLCTLSAINWGNMRSPEDFKKVCTLAVRGLDELLDYQNYPVLAAELSTMKRRPLGIGIINFAYWLAKNGLTYQHIDKQGLALVDEWAEAWSFYLIKASADLAAERGECSGSDETKYGQGITPNQTYSKAVDELIPHKERQDWKGLRKQLKETGIRNSTLMALMPSETSAQVANATNGIEPPRNLISVKQSKHGVLKQVVPEYKKLKNKYDLLWDQQSPEGYIKIVSVLQKYIDQGISVNTSYNPRFFEEEKIPMSLLLKHLLMFYKYGGKQLYYFNTNDGQGEIDVSTMEQRIDKVDSDQDTDQDCESCVI